MSGQPTQEQKATRFRALHEGEAFLIPNPWDAGSARTLEALGFQALATTSAGFAMTLGRRDGTVTLDELVEHIGAIDRATSLPVSVDLENGFGPAPQDAANAILRAAGAGAVGGSIEDHDSTGEPYDFDHAVERVVAASEAARSLHFPFTFTARADNYFRGNPDLDDTIARLRAFEQAGADVLYAPRLPDIEQVRAICAALEKPVNVLGLPSLTMAGVVDAGARRISVGGRLAWVANEALVAAAERLRDSGDFSALEVSPRAGEWLGS